MLSVVMLSVLRLSVVLGVVLGAVGDGLPLVSQFKFENAPDRLCRPCKLPFSDKA